MPYSCASEFVIDLIKQLSKDIGQDIKSSSPLNNNDKDSDIYYVIGDLYPVRNKNDGRLWHEIELQFEVVLGKEYADLNCLDLSTRLEREIKNHYGMNESVEYPTIISNEQVYSEDRGRLVVRVVTARYLFALGDVDEDLNTVIDSGIKSDEYPP